jgi:hypothetical protein
LQILRAQAHRRAPPRVAVFDDDGTATAATLAAARDVDVNTGKLRRVRNQCAVRNFNRYISWFEVNFLGGDDKPQ